MPSIHSFPRPERLTALPPVGALYSPPQTQYAEGARYRYRDGAHQLTLFWRAPTADEIRGIAMAGVELALWSDGPAAFLLYKVAGVCEWSDVAFNLHLVPEAERELPQEPTGERARFFLTLVDADDGRIKARRLLSLDKVMTQAIRHVMRAQLAQPFERAAYDRAVAAARRRFPDGEAMAVTAEFMEAALG